jgi:hypothetical protein
LTGDAAGCAGTSVANAGVRSKSDSSGISFFMVFSQNR